MSSLLRKDLLILARSRLLVGLLIAYPVVIALLIGFAISRTPSKPHVAIVDETPPGQTVEVGSRHVPVHQYAAQLFSQVRPVNVRTRGEAEAKVKSGQALAAVVIPPDIATRLESGVTQAHLELLYNGNALVQSIVQSSCARRSRRRTCLSPKRSSRQPRARSTCSCAAATWACSERRRI
jgi:ABC-2 type transport system permease protein